MANMSCCREIYWSYHAEQLAPSHFIPTNLGSQLIWPLAAWLTKHSIANSYIFNSQIKWLIWFNFIWVKYNLKVFNLQLRNTWHYFKHRKVHISSCLQKISNNNIFVPQNFPELTWNCLLLMNSFSRLTWSWPIKHGSPSAAYTDSPSWLHSSQGSRWPPAQHPLRSAGSWCWPAGITQTEPLPRYPVYPAESHCPPSPIFPYPGWLHLPTTWWVRTEQREWEWT